jgi:predicted membrane protein
MAAMLELLLKGTIAGVLVAAALWAQERSTALAAILVSLPLTSIIALSVLWTSTGSREDVSELSWAILLIILPSVVLFIALPLLLRTGMHFWVAMPLACATMALAYFGYSRLLARIGLG